jgi:hypothetical protein
MINPLYHTWFQRVQQMWPAERITRFTLPGIR